MVVFGPFMPDASARTRSFVSSVHGSASRHLARYLRKGEREETSHESQEERHVNSTLKIDQNMCTCRLWPNCDCEVTYPTNKGRELRSGSVYVKLTEMKP